MTKRACAISFAEPRWEAALGKLAETDSRAGLALWPAGDDPAWLGLARTVRSLGSITGTPARA